MLKYILNSQGDGYDVYEVTDKNAEKIVIPDMYEGLPVKSVSASFESCSKLKEIIIGNNVEKTHVGVFDCESLEKIYFGKSISTISGPFTLCKNLTDIYFAFEEERLEDFNFVAVDESFAYFQNAKHHFGVLGRSGLLTLEDETLFPYTHWDCVKGKPEKIDSTKVAYDNSVSGMKSDNIKDAIDELNARDFDVSSIETWSELKYLVRSGRAADFINIGDRFVCSKNNQELIWDVIGIDKDIPSDENFTHSLTLQLSECYVNMPFSVPEASCYLLYHLKPGQYYAELKNYASPSIYCSFRVNEEIDADTFIRISEGKVYFYKKDSIAQPYLTEDVEISSENENDMSGTKISEKIIKSILKWVQ